MPRIRHTRWLFAALLLLVVTGSLGLIYARSRPLSEPAAATWDEPPLPDSPAGRQVASFLSAFNSGDETKLSSFIRENFSPLGPGGSSLEDRIRFQQRLYRSSRGLNVFSIAEPRPGELELLAQFRLTQEWRQMTFMLESAPSHLISGIRIVPVEAPEAASNSAAQPFELALRDYLNSLTQAGEFSGVVVVADGKRFLFQEAFGLADEVSKRPITLDTPFNYASVGKMFTAVAIGQLLESGKLNLDDTLDQHLADYPSAAARKITIDHLLTHRSGIVDFFEAAEELESAGHSNDAGANDTWIFANMPLRFTPGERFEYSNSNYVLLGAIVEQLSGMSFDAYLKEHVFEPAGMNRTALSAADLDGVQPAIGYTELDDDGQLTPGTRRPNTKYLSSVGGPAGGGVTTAADMIKFADAVRHHRLLSPGTTAILTAETVATPRPNEHYCRGFYSRQSSQGRIVGHSGGFPGIDAQIDLYENGQTVVVLANYEGVGEPVARHIEKLLAR